MDQRAALAGVFDRAAPTYDRVGVELFGPIAERLVEELAPQPGERVLDVGCGRGAVLLRAADRVGPTGVADGVDLAPGMVAAAREEARAAGLEVSVWVGDAADPAPGSGPYDVVASSLVLFFLPDPAAALRAWRTLLVDGGRLGVTTFGGYGEAWGDVDAVFTPYLPPQARDARTTGRTGPFASDAGVAELVRGAGFADVRTAHLTVPVRFADEEHWHTWSWSVGQRGFWERVPEAERDGVRAQAYAALQRCRDTEGRIGFDQDVRVTLARRG
ncbi:class I SAM-dependent methyltransferase [Geodermatophilus sp. SYSU D00758]